MFHDVCRTWDRQGIGIPLTAQTGYRRFSHAIWADNVILGAPTLVQLRAMIRDMSIALYARGYKWKPSSLEFIMFGDRPSVETPLEVCFPIPATTTDAFNLRPGGVSQDSVVAEAFTLRPGGVSQYSFVAETVSAKGDSPCFPEPEEATQRPLLNRRNRIQEVKWEAKRRRLGDAVSHATASSSKRLADIPIDDSSQNTQYKRRRLRQDMVGISTGDPHLQARLAMLHAASPWTQEMDDFLKTLPRDDRCRSTNVAKDLTRRRRHAQTVGLRPWSFPFEVVGGAYWYENLQWTQVGWRTFVRTLCKQWSLEHILEYMVLPEPGPWIPKHVEEVEENMTEETKAKRDEKTAKRLACNFENASSWNFEAPGIPIELSGDSQTVVNWLLGQHVCTTQVYCDIVAHIQGILYQLSCQGHIVIRPPSWGHDPWKWFYREGNSRADAETWKARRGQEHLTYDSRLYHIRKNDIKGIRGYFDGGRSSHGVGIGWVVDVLVLSHSSSSPSASWIFDIASEAAAIPPTCTVCQAELLASQRLAVGVERLLHLAGSSL